MKYNQAYKLNTMSFFQEVSTKKQKLKKSQKTKPKQNKPQQNQKPFL